MVLFQSCPPIQGATYIYINGCSSQYVIRGEINEYYVLIINQTGTKGRAEIMEMNTTRGKTTYNVLDNQQDNIVPWTP